MVTETASSPSPSAEAQNQASFLSKNKLSKLGVYKIIFKTQLQFFCILFIKGMEDFVNREIQKTIDGIRQIRQNANLSTYTPYFDEWEEKFGVKKLAYYYITV